MSRAVFGRPIDLGPTDRPARRGILAKAAAVAVGSLIATLAVAPSAGAAAARPASAASTAHVRTATSTQLQAYVTTVYQDLFGRSPDASGLAAWTVQLALGAPRSSVAGAITSSPEYRSGLITGSYQRYLGRAPEPAGLKSWLTYLAGGSTLQQMEAGFVASPEFYKVAGNTDAAWVSRLYATVLDREAAPTEVSYWVGQLARGSSRTSVSLGFLLSSERLGTVIDGYYGSLLGRGIDPSGRATWVSAMQRGMRIETVIGNLVASDEYFNANVPAAAPDMTSCQFTARSLPTCGTLFGAAFGSNTDPTSFEASVGGTLGVRRTYFSSSQVSGAVNVAKADKAAGRVSWMSFKLPYSWAEMASGKGDAWAQDLAARLGSVNGHVWVAFNHEPENDTGNLADWVAMQRRLAGIVHSVAPNVAFTIILMGYHQFSGDPKYSLDNLWPGDGLVDVIGIDPYNFYGTVKNGSVSTLQSDLGSLYFTPLAAFARAHGTAWGVAETGYNDAAAANDPGWLVRTYQQAAASGAVAVSYFNTELNATTTWRIAGGVKLQQYAATLALAPTAF